MTFNELLDFVSIRLGEEPSSRRQRTRSVVLSACSPFVEADLEVDAVNPTLRLVHKTIADFLIQDPATIDFVTEDCYKFFVKYPEGNADIGRRCLTYLSYKRYANFQISDIDNNPSQHSFLKYASVFWHQHLDRAGADHELFELVRNFLKSPNFWTCVQIQGKYAPHIFAKLSYNTLSDTFYMRLPSSSLKIKSEDEYYADALPSWLGEYDNQGDRLVWGYHWFVREWSEVLVRHPEKIQKWFSEVLGSRSFWNSKHDYSGDVDVKTEEVSSTANSIDSFKGPCSRTTTTVEGVISKRDGTEQDDSTSK